MHKKTDDHRASSIRLRLQDRLGNPIRGLEVEIRGLNEDATRLYHSAKTDAEGVLHFVVARGNEVAVQVKRLTDDIRAVPITGNTDAKNNENHD
ncbi:hypothetical protein [Caballeronia novacaledonica]|uniref:hypothetical protein n=1 Tax=Caballeronia novacaledonica TaxID=1544861 RepID=UPI0011B1F4E3|nr:hypothetical protein [Caballeronia novacaledonica]